MFQSAMSHSRFVARVIDLVQRQGAAGALAHLRAERPAFAHRGGASYHDTRAVFTVWGVDRLLRAGLASRTLMWHPLMHQDSVDAWWTATVLDSPAAADHFVPSDRAMPGEPVPVEPTFQPTDSRRKLTAA